MDIDTRGDSSRVAACHPELGAATLHCGFAPSAAGLIEVVCAGSTVVWCGFADAPGRRDAYLARVAPGRSVDSLDGGGATPAADGSGATPAATDGAARATLALRSYLAGAIHALDELPIAAAGSEFERRVWAALRAIPAGTTWTYGEVARWIGASKAARAVGGACNRNPIGIVVPCHRVVGAGGRLVGYAGGIERKAWLLDHERRAARSAVA